MGNTDFSTSILLFPRYCITFKFSSHLHSLLCAIPFVYVSGAITHLREFLKGDDSIKLTLQNNFLLFKFFLPFSVLVQIFFLFSEISAVNGLILVLKLSLYCNQRRSVQLYPGLCISFVISSRIFFCCSHISDVMLEADVQARLCSNTDPKFSI